MKKVIDCNKLVQPREAAHAYLQEVLELPEYYGKNLDALYDCLTDRVGPLDILLENSKSLLGGSYGDRIAETLCEAAAVIGGHIIYAYAQPEAVEEESEA